MKGEADLLTRAAVVIFMKRDTYSCMAISKAGSIDRISELPAHRLFVEMFRDDGYNSILWFSDVRRVDRSVEDRDAERQHRVFALLLAAEVAKGGGL